MSASFWGNAAAEDLYYCGDATYLLGRSTSRLVVQLDTTTSTVTADLFSAHPCLDPGMPVRPIGRGFLVYGVFTSCGVDSATTGLLTDPAVKRVGPIYISTTGTSEFPVTDLVSVQFVPGLTHDSMLALLGANGLRFVDSSAYKSNLWLCALRDTIRLAWP